MVLSLIDALGPWSWFVLGLVLLIAEIFMPGTFILWLGVAAIAAGLLALVVDMTWQAQLIAFGLFAIVAVVAWWRLAPGRGGETDSHSMLNRRAERHVGREFTLDLPIEGGTGRLRIDDTTWRVSGPDCPAGTRMRVVRAEGALLVVERVES